MQSLSKNEIRATYRKKRFKLTQKEVEYKSKLITENFINNTLPKLLKIKPNANFGIYIDSYNEVRTKSLIEHFLENKINLSHPKIVAKNSELKFISFDKNSVLGNSEFYEKIQEIKQGPEILPDFLIVPLVACDKELNRIGMGGGFFDRTMAHFTTINHNFLSIGLAYNFQLLDYRINTLETDKNLDCCAFESFNISANTDIIDFRS